MSLHATEKKMQQYKSEKKILATELKSLYQNQKEQALRQSKRSYEHQKQEDSQPYRPPPRPQQQQQQTRQRPSNRQQNLYQDQQGKGSSNQSFNFTNSSTRNNNYNNMSTQSDTRQPTIDYHAMGSSFANTAVNMTNTAASTFMNTINSMSHYPKNTSSAGNKDSQEEGMDAKKVHI